MPDKLGEGVFPGPVLLKTMLEKTLPWKVKVRIINGSGDVVLEWDPNITIRHWEEKVSLYFGPKDLYIEEP